MKLCGQKSATLGCAMPMIVTGIESVAVGFEGTVLAMLHSMTVECDARCSVSHGAVILNVGRDGPAVVMMIGVGVTKVMFSLGVHEAVMVSGPVATASGLTVKRTTGVECCVRSR